MPASAPVSQVGDKLIVGLIDYSFIPGCVPPLPGTSVLNGPVWIGAGIPAIPVANCMIGPGAGSIAGGVSLFVTGISNITGITNILGNLNVPAISNFTGAVTVNAVSTKNGIDAKNAFNVGNDIATFNGTVTMNGAVTMNAAVTSTALFSGSVIETDVIIAQFGQFTSVAAPFKLFDIPHPNKKGMRLKHSCLEGPEIGVYYRGTLKGNNIIELPDYWRGLVDFETLTVHLTPHEYHQELFYKTVEWGKRIQVVNNSGAEVSCSFIVYAERIDVEKLEIEYEEKVNGIN